MNRPSLSSLVPFRRPRKIRATDKERDLYAEIVNQAYSEGQLDTTHHEHRLGKVLEAQTIGELDDLVADLVAESELPEPPPPPKAPKRPAMPSVKRDRQIIGGVVTTAVAIVGGIVIAGSAIGGDDGITMPDFPSVDLPGDQGYDITDVEQLGAIVDQIVASAGSSELTWLGFYDGYVLARGPGADGAARIADYSWRDGEVEKSPGSMEFEPEEVFDVLEDFDLEAVASLARSAPTDTGVLDPTSLYVFVERDCCDADRYVEIRVSLHNDYQDGSIEAESDGLIMNVDGPATEDQVGRFFQPDDLQDALDAAKLRLGHSMITEIGIYGEYVITYAPPTPDTDAIDSYDYRGGHRARKQDHVPIQPDDIASELFSIDDLDGLTLATSIGQAAELAELKNTHLDPALASYAYVERPWDPKPHDPVLVVFVDNAYDSKRVIFSLDGEVLQID